MSSPAVSMPAKPAPTTTKFSRRLRSAGSDSFSALSSISITLFLSSAASLSVFIVKAFLSTSGIPKKLASLPSATTAKS